MKREMKKLGLLAGVVAGVLFLSVAVNVPVTKHVENSDVAVEEMQWHTIWSGRIGEYDPGAGASGFLEIFCYPHDANPDTTYAQNDSSVLESNALAYADTDNFYKNLASETAFDIVVRARFNKTHAFDSVNNKWIGARCRVKITCSGDVTINNVTGTAVETANNSGYDFIWINFYWNNGGSGYQIPDDGSVVVEQICIEAKY